MYHPSANNNPWSLINLFPAQLHVHCYPGLCLCKHKAVLLHAFLSRSNQGVRETQACGACGDRWRTALVSCCPQRPKSILFCHWYQVAGATSMSLGSPAHLCGCRRYLRDWEEGSKNPSTQGLQFSLIAYQQARFGLFTPNPYRQEKRWGDTSCHRLPAALGIQNLANICRFQPASSTGRMPSEHFSTQTGKQKTARFPLVLKMRRREGPATPIWDPLRVKLILC